MVLNATFNNISVISWMLVVLVEETGVFGQNHSHLPQVTDRHQIMLYRVHLTMNAHNYSINIDVESLMKTVLSMLNYKSI